MGLVHGISSSSSMRPWYMSATFSKTIVSRTMSVRRCLAESVRFSNQFEPYVRADSDCVCASRLWKALQLAVLYSPASYLHKSSISRSNHSTAHLVKQLVAFNSASPFYAAGIVHILQVSFRCATSASTPQTAGAWLSGCWALRRVCC